MKLANITSGKFAKEGKKNFSGYDAAGHKFFIHKEMLEAFGVKTDAEFVAKAKDGGIWTIFDTKEYPKVDENNKPTGETFLRDTITALFETEDQAIKAKIASQLADIKAQGIINNALLEQQAALVNSAKELGLNEAAISALATASL